MSYRLTILGCGSSGGVPRVGRDWGRCDASEPRNRRRRCAVLIERLGERGRTRLLIDTGPDLREQLLSVGIDSLDGVAYTHDHADHTHGIDDLRNLAYKMKRRVDVWSDAATLMSLMSRFGYCFETQPGSTYPPILRDHLIEAATPFTIEGAGGPIMVQPVPQVHGDIASLGFRVGAMAYSPDISRLPDASKGFLAGLSVWIVDALRYTPHPSHYSVKEALAEIASVRPERAILTHLHIDLDYATLKRELPEGIEPAYDGLQVTWD